MNTHMHKVDTDFEGLTALPEFAKFSKMLTKLTGIPMSLQSLDGTAHISYGMEIKNPLCRIIRSTEYGAQKCKLCDTRHSKIAGNRGKPLLYRCHAGLFDMIVPLFVRGIHAADLSSGQILAKPASEDNFKRMKKRLVWLNSDDTRLRQAYFSAMYMPHEKVKHTMDLLEIFAVQLCESLRNIRELESRLERVEIRKAKAYIAHKFSDPDLDLASTAAHAGLSVAHFSHVFKQCAGISFTRYVRHIRVEEARKLLRSTEKSITEVCFTCGFNSLSDFIRVFRSDQMMTPGEFKAQTLLQTSNSI